MSFNLGPNAYDAIQRLKNNADWRIVVEALDEQMSTFMHRSLEGPPADRADATGYARAIRDLRAHIELVEKPENRNPKPRVRGQTNV